MDATKSVTAVFAPAEQPWESGFLHSASAEAEYGAFVTYVYENAAGWYVREEVTWGPPEPEPFCDCAPRGQIHVQQEYVPLARCDADGTFNPDGLHGCVVDRVRNENGPPYIVRLILINQGKSLPCSSTTEQVAYISPSESDQCAFVYEHEQIITLDEDAQNPDQGLVTTCVSGVGCIGEPWFTP